MHTLTFFFLACVVTAAQFACEVVENVPSSGRCTGFVGSVEIDADVIAAETHFYRDDQHFQVEGTFIELVVGTPASADSEANRVFVSAGHFTDIPSSNDVGEHVFDVSDSDAGFIDNWTVTRPTSPMLAKVTANITTASRERVNGSFDFVFSDDSTLSCALELGRNYDLDTDD